MCVSWRRHSRLIRPHFHLDTFPNFGSDSRRISRAASTRTARRPAFVCLIHSPSRFPRAPKTSTRVRFFSFFHLNVTFRNFSHFFKKCFFFLKFTISFLFLLVFKTSLSLRVRSKRARVRRRGHCAVSDSDQGADLVRLLPARRHAGALSATCTSTLVV